MNTILIAENANDLPAIVMSKEHSEKIELRLNIKVTKLIQVNTVMALEPTMKILK